MFKYKKIRIKFFYLVAGLVCAFMPLSGASKPLSVTSKVIAAVEAIEKNSHLLNLCNRADAQGKISLSYALHTQINANRVSDIEAYFEEWAEKNSLSLATKKEVFAFLTKIVETAKKWDNFSFCSWLATELEKNSENNDVLINFLDGFVQALPLTSN